MFVNVCAAQILIMRKMNLFFTQFECILMKIYKKNLFKIMKNEKRMKRWRVAL